MRSFIEDWARDLRHASRTLRRAPGFAAVCIITLGLALGVSSGMFGVVNTVLLDPLPYANADRLVYVGASAPGSDFPEEFGLTPEFYVEYMDESQLLEAGALYNSFTSTLRTDDRVERISMSAPTYTLFETLGAAPILGRLPVDADEDRVVVLSYGLWQSWFGGDSTLIGRNLQVAGDSREVIGIMGPQFGFPNEGTQLWFPAPIRVADISPGRFGSQMVARAVAGTTPQAIATELTTLSKRTPERFGGSARYAEIVAQHRAVVRTLEEQILGDIASPLWVLLAAVAGVLIIACANVANLFLVRAESRQREMAIRSAIGAGRGKLVRVQMAEAIVIALSAGVLAVVLALMVLPVFVSAAPEGIPRLATVGVDVPILLFTLTAAILAATACGLAPAIRASAPNLTRLREGGRSATPGRKWGRDGLVVGQTALALVLLISSGLLIRSYGKLSNVDPGYSTENIFTFQIAPEQANLVDGPSYAQFILNFMDRIRALPSVESVGVVENVPLDEGLNVQLFLREDQANDPDAGTRLSSTFAAADYFGTMGIELLRGRAFTREDNISTLGNVVISESAAEAMWPGEDAVGRRMQTSGAEEWSTVIGVVEDIRQYDFRDDGEALVYFPMVGPTPTSWWLSSPAYVVKTDRAEAIAPAIRALVDEIAPEAPMYRAYTMDELARRSMVQLSFTMLTLGVASLLALVLGAVGLYGVLSYIVTQRTREIGVRMALGARAGEVRRMVVAQGARVVAVGVGVGLLVSIAITRALDGLLYGVGTMDLTTFVGMSVVMIGIGLLASYLPARRASMVDPLISMRGD